MPDFDVAQWRVHPERNTISDGARERHLEPRVMDLLVYLAGRYGEVASTDEIIRDVWPGDHVSDSAVLTAISALRQALGDQARSPRFIETIPKRGYRFLCPTDVHTSAIAVLPFADLSADAEHAFLADGLTEMLIGELGRISGLRVIARQSVAAYRGSRLPVSQIAAALAARWLVTGSVLCHGDRARVSVELAVGAEDRLLWSQSYERGLGDVLALQREVAESVAAAISRRIPRTPEASAAADPDAVVAYLRGRFHWWKWSPPHLDRARRYFEEALAIEPRLARAHAGIADVWGAYGYWGIRPPSEVRDRVLAAARSAAECDRSSAEAQTLLGSYYFYYERDWQLAATHIDRAIGLNPSLAQARLVRGLLLATQRDSSAQAELTVAIRLDPLNPGALFARAFWLAGSGRHGAARAEIEQALEIEPSHGPSLQLLADLDWLAGSPGALESERVCWSADEEVSRALGASSERKALEQAAEILRQRAATEYVPPLQLARLLVHAHALDEALAVLEQAVDRDELIQVDALAFGPTWRWLEAEQRGRALLRRLGLPA